MSLLAILLIMFIWIILFSASIISNTYKPSISISPRWHQSCLDQINDKLKYKDLYQSLFCGKKFTYQKEKSDLKETGLYHLIVVSGSHLIFIKKYLKCIKSPRLLTYLILILFLLMNNLSPPVTRSFTLICLDNFLAKLGHNSIQKNFSANLICLIIFPHWISDLSFYLSSICGLAITSIKNRLGQCLLVYLLCLPVFLSSNSILNPASVLCNFIISPIFEVFLFPITSLVLFQSPISNIIDSIWDYSFYFLNFLAVRIPGNAESFKLKVSFLFLWSYWLLIAIVVNLIFSLIKRFSLKEQHLTQIRNQVQN